MNEGINRTVLYYPTIDIPNKQWIRQAVFYWDNISSIVPQEWDDNSLVAYSEDIDFLMNNKIFKPIRPEKLLMDGGSNIGSEIEDELQGIITSEEYRRFLGPKENWVFNSRVHQDKISGFAIRILQRHNLVKEEPIREDNTHWFLFENETSLLYMSLLARYLSEIDKDYVLPSTDVEIFKEFTYTPLQRDKRFVVAEALFNNILPVPKADVPIEDVIGFKVDYRDELLKFRKRVGVFEEDINKAENNDDIKKVIIEFKEECETSVNDIIDSLKENKINFCIDSLQTLIHNKTFLKTILASVGVVVGAKIYGVVIPLAFGTIAPAVNGSVEIISNYVKSRVMKSNTLKKSSFAYLYHSSKLT